MTLSEHVTLLAALAALVSMGCNSSSAASADDDAAAAPANVARFIGESWTGTETITGNCPGSTPGTTYEPVSLTFLATGTGLSVTTTTTANCVFDLSLSGDTATLSGGPVKCGGGGPDGGTVAATYSKYTLTTSDGQNLTGTFTIAVTSGGATCTSMGTITATR